jgi:hypothetical protein
MSYDDERRTLVRALRPLQAVLSEIILVGGWAHRLHAHHPLASRAGHLLNTLDADLFVPNPSPSRGLRVEALRVAGFEISLHGHESPPKTKYILPVDGHEFELDFLARRQGAEIDRHGNRHVTTYFGDVVALLLPFMDVMSHEPWTFTLDQSQGFLTGDAPMTLQIVSPAAYVAHKLMVLEDRQPAIKRHQDVRYLYETIRRFAPALPELRASWSRRTATKGEHARIAAGRRFVASGDLVTRAARTPDLNGMVADASHMRAVLEAGFVEIFGPLPR